MPRVCIEDALPFESSRRSESDGKESTKPRPNGRSGFRADRCVRPEGCTYVYASQVIVILQWLPLHVAGFRRSCSMRIESAYRPVQGT